jgi:hypothetical protein
MLHPARRWLRRGAADTPLEAESLCLRLTDLPENIFLLAEVAPVGGPAFVSVRQVN